MWTILAFLHIHRTRVAFSQLNPFMSARAGGGIPSISTAGAQARRCFAQVIHMLVHMAGQQSSYRPGSQQEITARGLLVMLILTRYGCLSRSARAPRPVTVQPAPSQSRAKR